MFSIKQLVCLPTASTWKVPTLNWPLHDSGWKQGRLGFGRRGGWQPAPAGAIIHTEQRQRHPTHPGVHPAVPRNSKDVQGGEEEGNLHAWHKTKSAYTSLRDERENKAFPGLFEVHRNNRNNNNRQTRVIKQHHCCGNRPLYFWASRG